MNSFMKYDTNVSANTSITDFGF